MKERDSSDIDGRKMQNIERKEWIKESKKLWTFSKLQLTHNINHTKSMSGTEARNKTIERNESSNL